MVGPWMIMDALPERMELVGTLSWLAHGCSVGIGGNSSGQRQERRFRHGKSAKYRKYQRLRGLHARTTAPPRKRERRSVSAAKSTKRRKYRCHRPVRGAREQHVGV